MSTDTSCDVVVRSPNKRTPIFRALKTKLILINLSLGLYTIFSLLTNGFFRAFSRRGFFCDDATIQYPIKGDTVSFKILLLYALVFPSIVIMICGKKSGRMSNSHRIRSTAQKKISDSQRNANQEIDEAQAKRKKRLIVNDDDEAGEQHNLCKVLDNSNCDDKSPAVFAGWHHSPAGSVKGYSDLQLFMFGFATTGLFTGIGKTTCGRLRPHFMARCKPDVNCSLPYNRYRYIEDFTCTSGLEQSQISYITTSWPSGHASIVFYSTLYMIFYLNIVLSSGRGWRRSPRDSCPNNHSLILSSIYSIMMAIAIYISFTRISDYHHHPTDVLGGSVIGSIIAILQAKYWLRV